MKADWHRAYFEEKEQGKDQERLRGLGLLSPKKKGERGEPHCCLQLKMGGGRTSSNGRKLQQKKSS